MFQCSMRVNIKCLNTKLKIQQHKIELQMQILIVEHTLQDLHYINSIGAKVPQALTN